MKAVGAIVSKLQEVFGGTQRLKQILRHIGMVTEQADEGMALVDSRGTVCFVNGPWARMHGFKRGPEVLGKKLRDIYSQEQMDKDISPFIDQAKRAGSFTGRMEFVRPQGTTIAMRMKMVIFRDPVDQVKGLVFFVTDIRRQKRQRKRLEQAEHQVAAMTKKIDQLHQEIENYKSAERDLQRYGDKLEWRLEEQKAELATLKQKDKPSNQPVRQRIEYENELADELEGLTDEPGEPVVALDTDKLQAMADLAKRLA
jgi:PAS domain S-box-containing protein